jgi:hypothetical protein
MMIPRRATEEVTALGTTGSAERYAMPGSHFGQHRDNVTSTKSPSEDELP